MALHSDRPWRRALIKLACQVFLGRHRAHYHSWLPSLSIEGKAEGKPGVVHFRGRRILSLLDMNALTVRAASRIVIIGSGPSVKGRDLSGLPSHSAILLNGAISLIGSEIRNPLAVTIEDERFVWRHFDMIHKQVDGETLCFFSPGVIRALAERDAGWLAGRSVVLVDDIRKPYGAPRRSTAALKALQFVTLNDQAGFSADPDRGVFQGGSVAISALQFALGAHPGTIGFLGVDISNADAPRFYETTGDTAFSGIAGAEQRILAHIAVAAEFAAAEGIELINHSPVSALRAIGLDYQPLDQTRA